MWVFCWRYRRERFQGTAWPAQSWPELRWRDADISFWTKRPACRHSFRQKRWQVVVTARGSGTSKDQQSLRVLAQTINSRSVADPCTNRFRMASTSRSICARRRRPSLSALRLTATWSPCSQRTAQCHLHSQCRRESAILRHWCTMSWWDTEGRMSWREWK